jgi:hypothetical protein
VKTGRKTNSGKGTTKPGLKTTESKIANNTNEGTPSEMSQNT